MRRFYSASISRTLISFEISMIIFRNNIRKLKAKQHQFMNSGITKNLRLSRIKSESLAGMTVALALIPESLAFAAIAKVVSKYQRLNKQVTLIGLNQESYASARHSGVPEAVIDFESGEQQLA